MIEFHSIYYYEFKGGETPAERAVVAMLESQVRGSRGRGSVMISYIQCIMYENLLLFDFFCRQWILGMDLFDFVTIQTLWVNFTGVYTKTKYLMLFS